MNTATQWELAQSVTSHVDLQSTSMIDISTAADSTQQPSDVSHSAHNTTPPRPEVRSMYSPVSLAFFGFTGTAVGAAGVTGSFGGPTSFAVTGGVLATMFGALLAARAVARRRHSATNR